MFNQFTGIGRLSADVESRSTQSGIQVVNFTLCCDSGYGDKKVTEFIRVVAWDKLAKICADYLQKGSLCMIQGQVQTRQWEDKDGNKRYTTEIVARDMRMLGGKGESGGQSREERNAYGQPPVSDSENLPF